MRSKVRSFHSPDVQDLATLDGRSKDDFGVFVQVLVGPADGQGEESFDLMVCSPTWLTHEVRKAPVVGRHHLVMRQWNLPNLDRELHRLFEVDGRDWEGIAQKLARIGHWEFEDYQENAA